MVPPLEAIADAIMIFEGWTAYNEQGQPSVSYRNRNPGNLEEDGDYRVFGTFIEGYQALLGDLHAKFTGDNSHGLGPNSTLFELFMVYAPSSDHNPTLQYCNFVAHRASIALSRPITSGTKLGDIYRETGT